jgi:hypothetical protein
MKKAVKIAVAALVLTSVWYASMASGAEKREAPVYERGKVTALTERGEHRSCEGCSPLSLAIARPGWRPYYIVVTDRTSYTVMGKPALEVGDSVLVRTKGKGAFIIIERLGEGMQEHRYRIISAVLSDKEK